MTENLGSALGAGDAPGPWRIAITTVVLVVVVSIYAAVTEPRSETLPATNAAAGALRGGCAQRIEPHGPAARAILGWPANPLRCVRAKRLGSRALPAHAPR
jgi:hypothetical protein